MPQLKTTTRLPKPIIVGAGNGQTTPVAPAPAAVQFTLPLKPTAASHDINDYSFLIHGEKKIGKSTFATFPDQPDDRILQLTFDPTRPGYELIQQHVPNWTSYMQWIIALENAAKSGGFPYKRIVVDGVDIMWSRCQTWCCKKLVVDHPADAGWGKGFDMVAETFHAWIDRTLALPCGIWFISHSDWREVETRVPGVKISKLVPLIKGRGEEILNGKVDGWMAYVYIEKRRALIILGDERTGAGHDCKGHFLTPEGERVAEIPMGESEEEAYCNFVNAFNNHQAFTHMGGKVDVHLRKPRIVVPQKNRK